MSDINWDLAPEGAVELRQCKKNKVVRWFYASGRMWSANSWSGAYSEYETIATRPQPERKTVEDAVEWVNNGNEICGRLFTQNKMLSFCKANNTYAFVSEESSAGSVETENWQPVCTRKEFEACVAAKSEPEWMHGIPPNGIYCKVNHAGEFVNCYLIGRDDMGAFVYRIDGQYHSTMIESNFKPIKPTITKSEAWDRVQVAGLTPQEVNERFTTN